MREKSGVSVWKGGLEWETDFGTDSWAECGTDFGTDLGTDSGRISDGFFKSRFLSKPYGGIETDFGRIFFGGVKLDVF